MSVGEVLGSGAGDGFVNPTTQQRWEMQLKGGGPTPFCRGADGRAVLRSSIREFLASEAMFHLGVDTTRALSLVVSQEPGDVVRRPWYDPAAASKPTPKIEMDDPRLARFPDEVKRQIIAQARSAKRDPDVMIVETCAITTRVAPSFTRIGHVDLFARRASARGPDSDAHAQLAQMVRHAAFGSFRICSRSTPSPVPEPPRDAHAETTCPPLLASAFLRRSGAAIAADDRGWLRVGFCQGNFNADNCLVAGRTMDYGPFGFMDAYDPHFAKWTGSGERRLRQPAERGAGQLRRARVLRLAVAGGRRGGGHGDRRRDGGGFRIGNGEDVGASSSGSRRTATRANRGRRGRAVARKARAAPARRRDGFRRRVSTALVGGGGGPRRRRLRRLERLATLRARRVCVLRRKAARSNTKLRRDWVAFLTGGAPRSSETRGGRRRAPRDQKKMDAANPKYVLREWMLVEAYEAAKLSGDFAPSEALQRLTARPYEEGTEEETARYYRPAPSAFRKAGTAFMS